MAEFRSIHTKIWREDEWFQTLEPDAKLLFIYLFTNASAAAAGIYRLPVRTMAFEAGLTQERVNQLLSEFGQAGKVFYQNGTVWVRKMREYQTQGSQSPQLQKRIDTDVDDIPDSDLKRRYLIEYRYPIDTPSIPHSRVGPDTDTDTDTDTVSITECVPAQQSPATQPAPTADAGPTAPSDPLAECIAYLHEPKANKPGAIGRIYTIRYGARYPPDYARLGAMAKHLSGGYIALAELIWRSVVPEGDPHDYLTAAVNGSPASRRTHGRTSSGTNGKDAQPVGTSDTREALERAAKQLDEWIAGGSPGQTDGLLPGGTPVAPDVGGA